MTAIKAARLARAAALLALAGAGGCGFTNAVYPLRGEDPQSIAVSGERQDFLSKTGASRTVETFRKAVRDEEWGQALKLLGPATRLVVQRRADELREPPDKVLEKRVVLAPPKGTLANPFLDRPY